MPQNATFDNLREPEILNYINECRMNGQTWTFIQDKLKEKFNIEVYKPETIKKAHEEIFARRDLSKYQEDSLMATLKEQRTKLVEGLERQNKDLEKIWDYFMAKDLNEMRISELLGVLKEQRERLKLVLDNLNKVENPVEHKTLNIYQDSQNMIRLVKEYLVMLERGGFITKNRSYPFEENGSSLNTTIDTTVDKKEEK